jgi:hypothetical protein
VPDSKRSHEVLFFAFATLCVQQKAPEPQHPMLSCFPCFRRRSRNIWSPKTAQQIGREKHVNRCHRIVEASANSYANVLALLDQIDDVA